MSILGPSKQTHLYRFIGPILLQYEPGIHSRGAEELNISVAGPEPEAEQSHFSTGPSVDTESRSHTAMSLPSSAAGIRYKIIHDKIAPFHIQLAEDALSQLARGGIAARSMLDLIPWPPGLLWTC